MWLEGGHGAVGEGGWGGEEQHRWAAGVLSASAPSRSHPGQPPGAQGDLVEERCQHCLSHFPTGQQCRAQTGSWPLVWLQREEMLSPGATPQHQTVPSSAPEMLGNMSWEPA